VQVEEGPRAWGQAKMSGSNPRSSLTYTTPRGSDAGLKIQAMPLSERNEAPDQVRFWVPEAMLGDSTPRSWIQSRIIVPFTFENIAQILHGRFSTPHTGLENGEERAQTRGSSLKEDEGGADQSVSTGPGSVAGSLPRTGAPANMVRASPRRFARAESHTGAFAQAALLSQRSEMSTISEATSPPYGLEHTNSPEYTRKQGQKSRPPEAQLSPSSLSGASVRRDGDPNGLEVDTAAQTNSLGIENDRMQRFGRPPLSPLVSFNFCPSPVPAFRTAILRSGSVRSTSPDRKPKHSPEMRCSSVTALDMLASLETRSNLPPSPSSFSQVGVNSDFARAVSSKSKMSCGNIAKTMESLEQDLDELARIASHDTVGAQARELCQRIAHKIKGEMTSMESDLLEMCSMMEEEFETQFQNVVTREIEPYQQCLTAVHMEVCTLFDRACMEVEDSVKSANQVQETLDKVSTELRMRQMQFEHLEAEKRRLEAELKALWLETRNMHEKNAAAIKDEVKAALFEYQSTLAATQSLREKELMENVEELKGQLKAAQAAHTQHEAPHSVPENAGSSDGEIKRGHTVAKPRDSSSKQEVLDLRAALRASEVECNRMRAELVCRNDSLHAANKDVHARGGEISALMQEISSLSTLMRSQVHKHDFKHDPEDCGNCDSPPKSCHSQNPMDSFRSPGLRPEASCSQTRTSEGEEYGQLPPSFRALHFEDGAYCIDDMRPGALSLGNIRRDELLLRAATVLEGMCNELASVQAEMGVIRNPLASGQTVEQLDERQSKWDALLPPNRNVMVADVTQGTPLVDTKDVKASQAVCTPAHQAHWGWKVFGETTPALRPAPALFGEARMR
jgi:hypothetical protein